MFTVEMDMDEILITILDDYGDRDDVSVFLYDDTVYIRQWNEKRQMFDIISMAPKMFEELLQAMKKPEGAYRLEVQYGDETR